MSQKFMFAKIYGLKVRQDRPGWWQSFFRDMITASCLDYSDEFKEFAEAVMENAGLALSDKPSDAFHLYIFFLQKILLLFLNLTERDYLSIAQSCFDLNIAVTDGYFPAFPFGKKYLIRSFVYINSHTPVNNISGSGNKNI